MKLLSFELSAQNICRHPTHSYHVEPTCTSVKRRPNGLVAKHVLMTVLQGVIKSTYEAISYYEYITCIPCFNAWCGSPATWNHSKQWILDSCAPVQRPRDFCKLTCIDFIPSQMDKLELKNLAKIWMDNKNNISTVLCSSTSMDVLLSRPCYHLLLLVVGYIIKC